MGAVQGMEAAAAAHAAAVKAAAAKPSAADRRNGAAPAGRYSGHGHEYKGCPAAVTSAAADAPPLPWYAASVPVDDLGVRVFPRAPPPGVHPRVLCIASEVPAFLAAITKSPFGTSVSAPILASATAEFRTYAARLLGAIPPADREHPPPAAVRTWWTADERRASTLTLAGLAALAAGDEATLKLLVEVLVLYARLTLGAAALAAAAPVGGALEKPLSLWRTTKWDLGWGWALGGMATPLLYDWLYHRLSDEQARVVRSAMVAGTHGRRAWGMGFAGPRIQSNWALYHGHLALYCAAIEGEGSTATDDALDPTVDALFSQLTENYVEYALHDSGHPIEDAYALNLGFREGSLALLALARRGANLFRHPKYQALWKSVLPHLLEARPGGDVKLLGGSSGNAWQYLTSIVVAKWAMPQEPLIDWLYGVLSGAAPVDPKARGKAPAGATVAYPRLDAKWQVRTEVALLGGSVFVDGAVVDARATVSAPPSSVGVLPPLPAGVTLPLTWYDPQRGKLVTRCSWAVPSPTLLILDARPEAYLIGHDTPDRGAITFSAAGRSWVIHNEWRHFHDHADFSGMALDGVGQVAKAPPGRWVSAGDTPTLTYGAVDLTYAHNWTWTQWAGAASPGVGWEPDVSAPVDFLPTGVTPPSWLPISLFGHPDVAFEGLYQWRRRIGGGWAPVDGITSDGLAAGRSAGLDMDTVFARNRLARVTRTAALVRPAGGAPLASRAYALLVDAVAVGGAAAPPDDGTGHVVSWRLALAPDVKLLGVPVGGDVLLGEEGEGTRRLLVRFLSTPVGAAALAAAPMAGLDARLDSYASNLGGGGPHPAKRLVVSRRLAPRADATIGGSSEVAAHSNANGAANGDGSSGGNGAARHGTGAGGNGGGSRGDPSKETHFIVLLYPHTAGEALPTTCWVEGGMPAAGATPGGETTGSVAGLLRVEERGGEVRHLRLSRGGGDETVVSDAIV